MSGLDLSNLDFVRELRLRQWARQHFVTEDLRRHTWHPVVLDEMRRRDAELWSQQIAAAADSLPHFPEAATENLDRQIEVPLVPKNRSIDGLSDAGSRFVPLEPTENWRLDSASSAVPKPHVRTGLSEPVGSTLYEYR